MKILADNQIPLLEYYFADQAEVLALPYPEITLERVRQANILLVRSQFKVNQDLLAGSKLQFIGSCVTGTDHLDIPYLQSHHIPWYAAEGCNTQSVVEYVLSVMAALQADNKVPVNNVSIGIIGVGRIGARLAQIFDKLGYKVLLHDPVRAEAEAEFKHVSLTELHNCDVITLHTPLTQSGKYPSYHLINQDFIKQQKPGSVIINTARGGVIDSEALLKYGKHLTWCLDVYEAEPSINLEVIEYCYIATPHIAGHSIQAKARGTEWVYQAAAKRFNWPSKSMPNKRLEVKFSRTIGTWQELLLALMDPRGESARMKQVLLSCSARDVVAKFSQLRKAYPDRYELDYVDSNIKLPAIWEAR